MRDEQPTGGTEPIEPGGGHGEHVVDERHVGRERPVRERRRVAEREAVLLVRRTGLAADEPATAPGGGMMLPV